MYDLYYWITPNGHKVTMLLEELAVDYAIKPVNIGKAEQFEPAFLKLSPNNRIPALLDSSPENGSAPISLFESGAILLYLAEKHRQFIPAAIKGRAQVLQWLFWQMGGLGPMCGQAHHFVSYADEEIPYAIQRYVAEVSRLYQVLDFQLAGREYICGDYSIADMACYPWIVPYERQRQDLEQFENLKRWHDAIKARPATIRAYARAEQYRADSLSMSDEEKKVLFSQDAATLRNLKT